MKLEQNQKYKATGSVTKPESYLYGNNLIKQYLVKAGFRDVVVTGDLEKIATGVWSKPTGEYTFSKVITDRLTINKA